MLAGIITHTQPLLYAVIRKLTHTLPERYVHWRGDEQIITTSNVTNEAPSKNNNAHILLLILDHG